MSGRVFRGVEIAGLRSDEERVSRIAAEIASPGVELREEGEVVRYRVYVPLAGSSSAARRLRDLWDELGGAPAATLRAFREPERDWGTEARRSFRGTAVGPFWIGPPWIEPPAERLAVRINPGRAFGTGLHPTTRIALRLLAGPAGRRAAEPAERSTRRVGRTASHRRSRRAGQPTAGARTLTGARVLDLGAGSGVLGLAALALGATRVVALDVDPHALANAAENRALNKGSPRLHLIAGSLPALAPSLTFDLVLANLETAILTSLLPRLARLLSPGGRLMVSGVTREQHEGLLAVARGEGLRCRRRLSEVGWWGAQLESRGLPTRPPSWVGGARP